MNFEQMAFRADGILKNVHLLMVLRSKKYCLNSQMSDKWDVEQMATVASTHFDPLYSHY